MLKEILLITFKIILHVLLYSVGLFGGFLILMLYINVISKVLGFLLSPFILYAYFILSKGIGFCLAGLIFPNLVNKIPNKLNYDFPSSLKSKTGWAAFLLTQLYIFLSFYVCKLFVIHPDQTYEYRIGFAVTYIVLILLPFIGFLRITKK